MERALLILDLDETLIHASDEPLSRPPDFILGHFLVYKRPHLDEFLRFCAREFEVAVWTSGSADYARGLVEALFGPGYPLAFVFSRERCSLRRQAESGELSWIKDLKKIKRKGYDLNRVIVIEDSPANLGRQYGNLVQVSPFVGDEADDELRPLMGFLASLLTAADVRKIEKRGWKNRPGAR